jgi:YggT family protein
MIDILAAVVNAFVNILFLLVIAHVILSYFMSPDHPIRRTIDSLVDPLLLPIRRVVPLIGMLDFSPMILIILVQLLGQIIISALYSLR